MNTAEVIARLQQALDSLDKAADNVTSAKKELDDARAVVHDTLRTTSNQIAARIGSLGKGQEQILAGIDAEKDNIKTVIARVQQLGN